MKSTHLSALAALLIAITCASASTLTVVPNAFSAAEGNSSSSTLFQLSASRLQVLYTEAFLSDAGITPGATITGLALRRNGGGSTGPAADTSMADYDIFMSQTFDTPIELTTTFANNIVGAQTQVRGGPITFPAGSIPGGATPNAFAPVIEFTTPYTYTGGSLLIEIRRSARTGDTTSFLTDVDNTVASQAGCRWLFNLTSNTALTGTVSSSAQILQLRFTDSAPCPGDYNNDGVVDLGDLLDFLGDWNPNLGQAVTPGTNGDVNNDGTVDLADLLAFLGDWNPNLGSSCP
ncbi:MAG: hypothetical protein KF768_11590 [Phycisphaeraceae bacterium]|nr:hypothetical protein [Phycisphaeraceae bacterium]